MTTTYAEQIKAKRGELLRIRPDAKGAYTHEQSDRIEALCTDIEALEALAQKSADAKNLLSRLAGEPRDEPEYPSTAYGGHTKAAEAIRARKGHAWATKSLAKVQASASGMGLKSIFSGALAVDDPIITSYSTMPELPTTLLDLIPVEGQTEGSRADFLRQTVRDDNAAPVAMGDLKPTSVYSFDDAEVPFEVIAHISEPLNNVWASDYPRLIQIVGSEMEEGVRKALENQVLNGTGVRPQLQGIMSTSGVTQVAFATDVLTTLRRAHTVLTGKGEAPTGYVINPNDAEAIELMRADGATGQFLDFSRVFPVPVVQSFSVPQGQALLADWRATRLTVREGMSTLAFQQHADLAAKNQFIIRSEGRYAFYIERPAAVAVVDLTA